MKTVLKILLPVAFLFVLNIQNGYTQCGSVISIPDCGSSYSQTYTGGGSGVWSTIYCGYNTPGEEQIYSFTAPTTGEYSIEVTAASGYVDYGWQAGTCAETGWTCIGDITSAGNYGSMSWNASTTYYILLDDENSITGTHSFYITCPPEPPDNDLCSNATALPCGTTDMPGSTNLTTDIVHGTGCSMSNYGVWYTFTGDGDYTTIESTSSGFDHEMAITSGS
ncbi:MAG: hypothetical protein PF590_02520, partial [Candidatus Delongbacteria bacterium]|nr:hypothetical protein [Candidatus Delongbacteria bacterium]